MQHSWDMRFLYGIMNMDLEITVNMYSRDNVPSLSFDVLSICRWVEIRGPLKGSQANDCDDLANCCLLGFSPELRTSGVVQDFAKFLNM